MRKIFFFNIFIYFGEGEGEGEEWKFTCRIKIEIRRSYHEKNFLVYGLEVIDYCHKIARSLLFILLL